MPGHVCYHCKQWVEEGEPHDCWTTTEGALTRDLPDDLREAWERLRETAADFGEQRIYASHNSIMFARKTCYFFVRPKKTALEVCVFLGRMVKAPQVRCTSRVSRSKIVHTLHLKHRDEVEAPVTDWLLEAYDMSAQPATALAATKRPPAATRKSGSPARTRKPASAKKGAPKRTRPAAARKKATAKRR